MILLPLYLSFPFGALSLGLPQDFFYSREKRKMKERKEKRGRIRSKTR